MPWKRKILSRHCLVFIDLPGLPGDQKLDRWLVVSIVFNAIGIFTILSIGALSNLALSATGLGLLSIRIWVMIIAGVIGNKTKRHQHGEYS